MYICSIYEFVIDMKQWKHKKMSSIMVEVIVFFITELGMVIDDSIFDFLGGQNDHFQDILDLSVYQ